MPYQVTMDRTLSESEIDRLIQSELNRRKYYTKYAEETDEEFIEKFKESLGVLVKQYPSGRFRNIRWQNPSSGSPTNDARINPEDPLGLEAHPTENILPIIFTSFCHPCSINLVEGDGEEYTYLEYWSHDSESVTEEIQRDWEMNGGEGDFRDKMGIVGNAMWNDNPDTGENSAQITMKWRNLPHVKGFCTDPDYISLIPMIEYFKSIGVTHNSYSCRGSIPKKFVKDSMHNVYNHGHSINGNTRETHPSDFPWTWGYNYVDDDETIMFVPQFCNCEDFIQDGPEHIRDFGWPGIK